MKDVKKTRTNAAKNVPPDKVAKLPQAIEVAKKGMLKKFERVINLLLSFKLGLLVYYNVHLFWGGFFAGHPAGPAAISL